VAPAAVPEQVQTNAPQAVAKDTKAPANAMQAMHMKGGDLSNAQEKAYEVMEARERTQKVQSKSGLSETGQEVYDAMQAKASVAPAAVPEQVQTNAPQAVAKDTKAPAKAMQAMHMKGGDLSKAQEQAYEVMEARERTKEVQSKSGLSESQQEEFSRLENGGPTDATREKATEVRAQDKAAEARNTDGTSMVQEKENQVMRARERTQCDTLHHRCAALHAHCSRHDIRDLSKEFKAKCGSLESKCADYEAQACHGQ